MSAIIASSEIVTATAEALNIEPTHRTEGVFTAHLRRGPRSVNILPTYTAELIRVEFVTARGYEGIEESDRIFSDPATAAAAVESFFETGTI